MLARNLLVLWCIGIMLLAGGPAGADRPSNAAIEKLANEPVSRLEWGLERFERALVDTFAIDPVTLETSSPPFFINVSYEHADAHILVEIGRTFASMKQARADDLCREYIVRVRGMLSVDRAGRPAIKGSSSLAADFFHPLTAAAKPDPEFANALDAGVALRALVPSPVNGVFAICTAALTNSPVRLVR
ncbi:MAG: hypothetical protein QF609_01250 [Gammaproteobacteria bacterium]|jgi:hypothetical protein|nr:hypothetical protein [Gammaproteobacteria bacterium]